MGWTINLSDYQTQLLEHDWSWCTIRWKISFKDIQKFILTAKNWISEYTTYNVMSNEVLMSYGNYQVEKNGDLHHCPCMCYCIPKQRISSPLWTLFSEFPPSCRPITKIHMKCLFRVNKKRYCNYTNTIQSFVNMQRWNILCSIRLSL